MSGSEGDGYKSEGRALARPLLFLCSSAGSFSCMAVQREVFSREGMRQGITGECILLSRCAMQGFWARFLSVYECST